MSKKSFLDIMHEKGKISDLFYDFLLKKQPLLKSHGLSQADLMLLYYILPEKEVVKEYNEEYNAHYECITDIIKTDDLETLRDLYSKMPNDLFPLEYNAEEGTLVITGFDSDYKSRIRELIMTLGISNITYKKGFGIAVRYVRRLLAEKEDPVLELFLPVDKVQVICLDAVEQHATDVHFRCFYNEQLGKYEYVVRFRIASELEKWDRFPITEEDNKKMVTKIVNDTRTGSDGGLDTINGVEDNIPDLIGDNDWAARVSAAKVLGGYKCILRLHRTKMTALSLEQLGFDDEVAEKLFRITGKEFGSTWVTGKTGSGKNTTINSILKLISTTKNTEITEFSNPVEVLLPGVTQQEYKNGDELLILISLLKKQDPDLVFVGEIPDKKIANGVKELIDSNVQVITTTHLDRCYNIPQKLYDYYEGEYSNVLGSLNAVITQVMFRELCPECKEEITNPTQMEFMYMGKLGVSSAYRAHEGGCEHCHYRGYNNKIIPRAEVLEFNQDLVAECLHYKTPIEMAQYLRKYVFSNKLNIEVYVARLVQQGRIDIAQVQKRNLCDD